MKELFNSIAEIYEVYILRDLSKILTGCVIIISWYFYASNLASFNQAIRLIRYFSKIPFGITLIFIGISYLLGTLLQEIFSRIPNGGLFPLEPKIVKDGNPFSYSQGLVEIFKTNPNASRLVERIVLSKHIASSTGIILINLLIIVFLVWINGSDKTNLYPYFLASASLVGIYFSREVCISKIKDQEDLINGLLEIKPRDKISA